MRSFDMYMYISLDSTLLFRRSHSVLQVAGLEDTQISGGERKGHTGVPGLGAQEEDARDFPGHRLSIFI